VQLLNVIVTNNKQLRNTARKSRGTALRLYTSTSRQYICTHLLSRVSKICVTHNQDCHSCSDSPLQRWFQKRQKFAKQRLSKTALKNEPRCQNGIRETVTEGHVKSEDVEIEGVQVLIN